MNPVHYSRKSDEWETPQELFEELDNEFHFTLDSCCQEYNAKCSKHYTIKEDGLKQSWANEIVFMNPPYSNCKKWIEKAYHETKSNKSTVVALIPARTDTSWFHTWIFPFCGENTYHDFDIAWATGIIDGEGCVRIDKNFPTNANKLSNPNYRITISVKMICQSTINKLKEIFACGSIYTEHRPGYRLLYKWEVSSSNAINILRKIYPFSITKRSQIFNALEFAASDTTIKYKNNKNEILERKEFYYNKLKQLKQQDDNNILHTKIRWIRGRLKFVNRTFPDWRDDRNFKVNPAPFPSCIVIFRPFIE